VLGIRSLLAVKNLSGLGEAFKSFKLAVFMALKSPVLYLLDAGGCKKLAQFRYIFETSSVYETRELILNLIIKRAMSSAPSRLPSSSRSRQRAFAMMDLTRFKRFKLVE
jgi:hypothetical protein